MSADDGQWVFYFPRDEERPGSILVDRSFAPAAPMPRAGQRLLFSVHLVDPTPEGLSSQGEFDTLVRLEDACFAHLGSDDHYVGRLTSGGARLFWIYTDRPKRLADAFGEVLAEEFEPYAFDCRWEEDEDWKEYLEFLLPDEVELQQIMDMKVLGALAETGDVHSIPREVDHHFEASDEAALVAIAAAVGAEGFEVGEPDRRDDGTFELHVRRTDPVELPAISAITQRFCELAREHGASYDGWGCHTTTEADA